MLFLSAGEPVSLTLDQDGVEIHRASLRPDTADVQEEDRWRPSGGRREHSAVRVTC